MVCVSVWASERPTWSGLSLESGWFIPYASIYNWWSPASCDTALQRRKRARLKIARTPTIISSIIKHGPEIRSDIHYATPRAEGMRGINRLLWQKCGDEDWDWIMDCLRGGRGVHYICYKCSPLKGLKGALCRFGEDFLISRIIFLMPEQSLFLFMTD